jgi:predicted phage terminase large subunit-like protein
MNSPRDIRELMAAGAGTLMAEKARRRLHFFLRHYAWPVLEPATEFVDNWHIGAICEHLEAVAMGQIKRLIINMPFRMLKSTIVSQAFPAWEWASKPSTQYLTSSYAADIATRDAVACRRIIESEIYRRAWGHVFSMTSDQNVKTYYENNKRGHRIITSTDGRGTGLGGNRLIVDDPISAKEADSEPARASAIEWWKGTMSTRMNNPKEDAIILVHQRLHSEDTTGYVLANETEIAWDHLILPMRFEKKYRKTTSLGFIDPRKKEDELLMPQRLDEATVKGMSIALGSYHTDAQLQQRPGSRGGIIFDRANWRFYKALPTLRDKVISVDCSFKDTKSSDFVAIHVWGLNAQAKADKYLVYRVCERLGFGATVQAIRAVKAKYPDTIAILIEDKANGPAVIESLQKEVAGVLPINPEGGKVPRAYAMQPEHEAGNIWVPDPTVDTGIEAFLSQAGNFPNVKNDDEVDAMTQAVNWYRKRSQSMGLVEYMKEQAEAARKDK